MIRKQDYPPDWPDISLKVRTEAGWRCEWCGAPNGKYIIRRQVQQMCRIYIGEFSKEVPFWDFQEVDKRPRSVKIILTVAHLDRDTHNNEHSNLAALCQRCHLNHDRQAQHIPNRKYGRHHAKEQQGRMDF